MNSRQLVFHVAGMAVAYTCVLIVPKVVDFSFDTHTELYVIVWLTVGLLVMQIKQIRYPAPAVDRVDIVGGLLVLWWALFWPRYLR